MSPPLRAESVGLTWLIRFRWLTLAAQALAVGTAMTSSDPPEPLLPVGLLVLVGLSNVVFAVLRERAAPPVGMVLVVDTLVLTALLHVTGGPMNPFTALYFVYITMAAVLLGTRWVVGLLACSLAGYAVLFFVDDLSTQHLHDLESHLQGMWIAFGVAAALITAFVTRLTAELSRREAQLLEERERAARSAHVAALTSLAAGAAHELGTPIGTMVIAAGELERVLSEHTLPAGVLEDVTLIREEGLRCRAILDGLSAASGEARGEGFSAVTLGAVVERALERLGPERARVSIEGDAEERAELPPTALAVALRNVLRNALEASASDAEVTVSLEAYEDTVRFDVGDRGSGMSEEVRARAMDPFFTTKGVGEGMGLGLFLVRALADQLGGELVLESTPGHGSIVSLRLPRTPRSPP